MPLGLEWGKRLTEDGSFEASEEWSRRERASVIDRQQVSVLDRVGDELLVQ